MAMKLGAAGIKLIKSFEGCRLSAYKAVSTERYWTIGWGHYGSDIRQGQAITQSAADAMFDEDIQRYVSPVNALGRTFNQNQFDALVSFCYNCGAGSLKSLCKNRTNAEISDALLLYNKSGGNVLAGLTRRRKAEKELFDTTIKSPSKESEAKTSTSTSVKYHAVVKGDAVSKIAKKYSSTITQIKSWNKLDSKYTIQIGQRLRVK